jgi:hypothetical protein
MDEKHSADYHLLLFRCKRCVVPLPVTVISLQGNLEKIDGHMFASAQPNSCDYKWGSLKMPS